jgi:hypothetical protein
MDRIPNQSINKYPQKVAVEFGEQSLTYNELIFHAQEIVMFLLQNSNLTSKDVIYQSMKNNLSKVRRHTIKRNFLVFLSIVH